jgi:2-hydroxymuconate-semialdehyde hydrolase
VPPLLAIEEAGDGEPLVLVHGIATDRGIWRLVVPELAAQRRVITVDVPGFGASTPVAEDFDLEQVADRIVRGLAAQGVSGPFDLVGHSLGGAIATILAVRRPRLVRQLVLVAPAGLQTVPVAISNLLAASADGLLAVRRRGARLAQYPWGRRVLLALATADGNSVSQATAEQMLAASASAQRTAQALRTVTTTDLRPALAAVAAPISVIWGEADLTIPIANLEALLAIRPDAVVLRIATVGHVPMVEAPAAFAGGLMRLLADGSRSGHTIRREAT